MVFLSGGQDEAKKAKGQEVTSGKGIAEKSANVIIGEAVTGIRTVASFNLETLFYDNFMKNSTAVAKYGKKDAIVGGLLNGFTKFG